MVPHCTGGISQHGVVSVAHLRAAALCHSGDGGGAAPTYGWRAENRGRAGQAPLLYIILAIAVVLHRLTVGERKIAEEPVRLSWLKVALISEVLVIALLYGSIRAFHY